MPELSANEVKQAILQIENADFEKLNIEDFERYLTSLLRGYALTAPKIPPGTYLYRGRICQKPKNIKEMTYPPTETVKECGRANTAGETFFYAAAAREVPFFELGAKKGEHIALSRWRTTDTLFVNHIGFSKKCGEQLGSNRKLDEIYDFVKSTRAHGDLNLLVHDYLALKFSKSIMPGEEQYYRLTIAISRKLFKSDLFSGLLYPAIAMAGNADNIVLKKEFVDKSLEFKSIEYIEIKGMKDRQYEIEILDSATKMDQMGNFLWLGRRLHWQIKENGGELTMKSENGMWSAYDRDGNCVEPE